MLTNADIARLAARKNVNSIAVQNFLGSCGTDKSEAWANLRQDARAYKWNAATVKAISDGIAKL